MSGATSANTAAIHASTVADDYFQPSSTTSSNVYVTQAFHFSFGNPRIEETRGVMHLFVASGGTASSSSSLPVGRSPHICVLGVPNDMTYADFCQYCGPFIHRILEMHVVRFRNDGIMENRYGILVKFEDQNSTDEFYKHFNGNDFSSMETESCRMLFIADVQYTRLIVHTRTSPASTEEPSCAVCHGRLGGDMNRILTTLCNHSFHCLCIMKWKNSLCPACRYYQEQPKKSKCLTCETSVNVWMCLFCGFLGCGRYKEGHAIDHWKETEHMLSVELKKQCIWDHIGKKYVYGFIDSLKKRTRFNPVKFYLKKHAKWHKVQAKLAKSLKVKRSRYDVQDLMLSLKETSTLEQSATSWEKKGARAVKIDILARIVFVPAKIWFYDWIIIIKAMNEGDMHLFLDDAASSSSNLPVGRTPIVCVLGVPNHMAFDDFCRFCGLFIHLILEVRVVRIDGMEKCSYLVTFNGQDSADAFHKQFHGSRFPSLELCLVLFTADVQYTHPIEHTQTSPASTKQPSCSVCLESLHQDVTGLFTTMCKHSFRCSCISKWAGSSWPVCSYCEQQPEKSKSLIRCLSDDFWICIPCVLFGCGRYKEEHTIEYWKEAQDCNFLKVDEVLVLLIVASNYKDFLPQTEGAKLTSEELTYPDHMNVDKSSWRSEIKSIELSLQRFEESKGRFFSDAVNEPLKKNAQLKTQLEAQQPVKSKCSICQTSEDVWKCLCCGSAGCGRYKEGHAIEHWKKTQHCYSFELETQLVWDYVGDNYVHQLIQAKTDGKLIASEYRELIATQLENQKIYYESLLQEDEKQNEMDISDAVNKSLKKNKKLKKMQAKLDKSLKERELVDDFNESLLRNKEIWQKIIVKTEDREKETLKLKDKEIQELEAQLQGLMLSLDETTT